MDGLKDAGKALKNKYDELMDLQEVKDLKKMKKTNGALETVFAAKTETDAIRAAAELAAVADPSGIASTVAAYAFDTCDKLYR